MCYAQPRPRCSGHAKEALTKAQAAHTSNPTTATATALREAESDFAITPEGIKQVRAAASKAIDDRDYKRSALLSREADNRESLRELLSESVKGVRDPSPIDYIPYVVAAHHDPEFAYGYFARSNDRNVRYWVAVSPRTTSATALSHLAEDEGYMIRVAVAGNPNTPTEALSRLAKAEESSVRMNVAGNPNTHSEVLWTLTDDDNADVHTAARSHILESPTMVATRLGMSDDVSAVETMLRDHPSQVKSMLGWR